MKLVSIFITYSWDELSVKQDWDAWMNKGGWAVGSVPGGDWEKKCNLWNPPTNVHELLDLPLFLGGFKIILSLS